jgi:hypothetical protein
MAAAAAICATATSPGRRDGAIAGFGHSRLTRRQLIAAALGLGAAVPGHAEEPRAMLPQSAVAYQTTPKGLFSCAACTFFIPPGGCKVVSGDISPSGWCKLFDLAD